MLGKINEPLPEYVATKDGAIYRVTGRGQQGGLPKLEDAPYQGIDIKGNVNLNLFPRFVIKINREMVEIFLNIS